MKRELWSIGSTFGYAIRVLNSIFCSDLKEQKEYEQDDKWLVAEQVNSLCSQMMIEDAQEILAMVSSMPVKRLCEVTNCHYHHPDNFQNHTFRGMFEDKCNECTHNTHKLIGKEKKKRDKDHFTSK